MLAELFMLIVTLAVLGAWVFDRRDARRQTQHLLGAQDAERWAWSRERWDLMTRLQSPEAVRYAPPPPPPAPTAPSTQRPAEAPPHQEPDLEPDESHLVGTIISSLATGG
jgi:hypothetical protein